MTNYFLLINRITRITKGLTKPYSSEKLVFNIGIDFHFLRYILLTWYKIRKTKNIFEMFIAKILLYKEGGGIL